MELIVVILVGWFLLSVPVALVVGRVLRRATELPDTVAQAAAGGPAAPVAPVAPPRQRGAGPQAA